ncbi:MAG: envelope integrity protein Cei [Pseudonocardiaceae bacterium]|nr:envelope integrity protein Cei [Pseudonocardiaceae bacterium]
MSSTPRPRSPRYRRRRPLPALVVLALLGVVTVVVWVAVLGPGDPDAAPCPPPAPTAPDYSGRVLAPGALDTVAPTPPKFVSVRVLNGNGMVGEAGIVQSGLAELGFPRAAEPRNDPLHPEFALTCHAQIRFGAQGTAAARTLSLVVPCAELVRDRRTDDVVDLALGTEFTGLRPTSQARSALNDLVRLSAPPPPSDRSRGGQAGGSVQPTIDPALLQEARDVRC